MNVLISAPNLLQIHFLKQNYVQVILGVSKLGRDTHTHMYTRLNLYMST